MLDSPWSRRDLLRRSAAFGALAVASSGVLGACTSTGGSGNALDAIKKQRFANVGIAGEVPYGYTDQSGRVTGESPEVARAVFQKMGVPEIKAKQVAFNQLIPALNAGQFDMVCAGMAITPPRCQNAQFSAPDYQVLQAFLVPRGNPRNVRTFDDIVAEQLTVAVESGAVEKTYATKIGVPDSHIATFESPQQLVEAVTSGRAYAAALSDITLKHLAQQNPTTAVEVTSGYTPVIDGKKTASTGGFVFRTNDRDLVDAFNTQLVAVQHSGEWAKIVEPFGFTAENLPAPGVTTQSLCSGT